jgi:MFS family permease
MTPTDGVPPTGGEKYELATRASNGAVRCEAGNGTVIAKASSPGDGDLNVTCLADIIGESGPWQRRVCYLKMTFALIACFNSLGKAFYAPKQDYWCVDPATSLPLLDGNGTLQRCGCTQWGYDAALGATIISEWDLVCEYGWIPSATQSIFMVGVMVAALGMSQLSDLWGRVPTYRLGHGIELLGGLVCVLSGNIWHFSAGRFLVALGAYTKGLSAHIMVIEALGTSRRAFWTQINSNGFQAGYLALPWVAYFIRWVS